MPEKLGTAVLELRTDNSRLLAGMASAKQRVANLGKSFTRAGRSMTTGLTLPIVAAGTAATKLAADFEKSMSEIVGLVGVSQGQVDQWSEQIKRLGPELGKSPKELADAMFFITSAGLRGAEAMDTLVASAKASAGGLGDITAVADAATSAMNAYGSENLSASEATDILVATVREGKVAADELAGSIGKVIPMASVMGVEFNEVGAVLAGLTRIGFDSATATTALRATMTGLLKPTSEAEDTLKEMGLSSEGLRKQIKEEGLLAVLFELNNRFQGNEAALAKVFPNVRALSGVLGVLGDNSDEVQEIMGRMADNTGATESAFKVAADTLTFQFNIAMANLKTALIEVGEVVGPIVVPAINQIGEVIRRIAVWFKELNPQTQRFVVIMAAVAAGIGPVLVILGTLVTTIGALAGVVSAAAVPWIALAIAVAGAAYLIIKNWDDVKAAFLRFANNFNDIGLGLDKMLAGVFMRIYTSARDYLVDKISDLQGWLRLTWDKIYNVYVKAHNAIVGIWGGEQIEPIDISAVEDQLKRLDAEREVRAAQTRQALTDQINAGKEQIAAGAKDIGAQASEIGTALKDTMVETANVIATTFTDLFAAGGVVPQAIEETGESTNEVIEGAKEAAENFQEVVYDLTEAEMAQINDSVAKRMELYELQQQALADAAAEERRIKEEEKAREAADLEERKRNIQSFARSSLGAFAQTFEGMATEIIDGNATLWDAFKEAGKEAIAAILKALGQQNIVKAATQIAEAIGSFPNFAAMAAHFASAAKFTGAAALAYASAGAIKALQFGGLIEEPVVGVGLQTGSAYSLAEAGPERVSSGEQPMLIHNVVNLDGRAILDFIQDASFSKELLLNLRAVVDNR